MNKKILLGIAAVITISLLFVTGCGKKVTVKEDLTNLDKQVTNIVSTFKADTKKLGDTINTVEGLKKVEAICKDTQKKFKAMDAKTDEVKDLKDQLVSGFGQVVEGVNGMVEATEKKDKSIYDKAEKIGESGSKKMQEFFTKAKALAKKEGVTLKMKEFE